MLSRLISDRSVGVKGQRSKVSTRGRRTAQSGVDKAIEAFGYDRVRNKAKFGEAKEFSCQVSKPRETAAMLTPSEDTPLVLRYKILQRIRFID